MGVRLEFLAQFADLDPGFEIVAQVMAVLDMDDFSELAAEQREGPLDVDNANGELVLVQHQNVAVDAGRCRACSR